MCTIDHQLISNILSAYQLENHIEGLQNVVDIFLSKIFFYYEELIKTIYRNLLENEELSVSDVDSIISEWASGYPY